MARIVAGNCATYDTPLLKAFFAEALEELGFSAQGVKVLFKPNLLSGKPPKKAVNTHPLFVQALAEVFLERRCTIFVGDSPGFESTKKALEKSGIMDVIRTLGLKVAPFDRRVAKANGGISPYKEFLFAEDPLDYDVVVNMPKLKTHIMTGLTAGVKNTFGFIPHLDKAKWHLRCGADKSLFASVLIDIHSVVKPALTVLDGVVAMDGEGPSNGRVRDLGLVAVADNAFALDSFLERTLCLPSPLPVSRLAREKGLVEEATVADLGMPKVSDFRMPKSVRVDWNLPTLVRETARSIFTSKPKCSIRKCTVCMTCLHVCPAGALTMEKKGVSFDYKRCIRCYCCQEMCPTGAITV
jgi:uncharacterized protein (DUF362 family)